MISAREVVERAGVDVNTLIGRLASAAAAELSAVYRYLSAGQCSGVHAGGEGPRGSAR
ncbi:hypothetical protein Sme01_70860 [Sphaerisporangium melleum]|nr:hypothetical protein Sme01_70860 [Sphaerisporangium melleum]